MKKTIGILGGISAASTIHYYKGITDLYYKRYQNYYYPEILIHSLDFQYFTDLENQHRTEEYINYILKGIEGLRLAGADVIIMAANSPHSVFKTIQQNINLPMISIVEATAQKAKEKKFTKLLLTGIKYTMQSTFYQDIFKKYGIEVITPATGHQNEINSIIFDELVIQHFPSESRSRFIKIINNYSVDGVILGCTELPLLLSDEEADVSLLDTVSLHIQKTLDYVME